MNSPIRTMIRESYPKMEEMPFCSALKEGRFGRTEILRSEIVELYRALNTRGRIQDIYKRKLQDGMQKGSIHPAEVGRVEDVIDDEGETDEHIDHLDMRFKLFDGTVISRASTLRRNDELESINKAWTDVCEDSDILTLMTVMAAIEDWYSPLSGFFEVEYRKRGFAEDALELFIVHKDTDVDHSATQFDVLDKRFGIIDRERTSAMLRRAFQTSRGYDAMKLKLAETECTLEDLIEPS